LQGWVISSYLTTSLAANNYQPYWHVAFRLFDEHRSSFEALRLSDHFNRPQIIEEGNNFDDLALGMHTQPQESSDKFFTTEVSLPVASGGLLVTN
jgi:hypothetical protein